MHIQPIFNLSSLVTKVNNRLSGTGGGGVHGGTLTDLEFDFIRAYKQTEEVANGVDTFGKYSIACKEVTFQNDIEILSIYELPPTVFKQKDNVTHGFPTSSGL